MGCLRVGPRRIVHLSAAVGLLVAATVEAGKPNVVFIMADDLGWGDLGCYGAERVETPHIDRLAKEGARLTDAHSPSACCTPTRYAVLTGRYSWRTRLKRGVLHWRSKPLIDRDRPTVASVLRDAGYATGAVGKWHLGVGRGEDGWKGELRPGPLEVGFDRYFGMPGPNHGRPILVEDHRLVYPADASRIGGFENKELKRRRQRKLGPKLAERAVRFIEDHRDEPFFLYYVPCAIHTPYTPAKRFRGTSEWGKRGDFIHQLDWCVGRVLKTLRRLDLKEETLVVFTSDNGGDHPDSVGPFRAHKTSVYEGGHRVPLLARWPGRIPAGRRSDQMVSLIDLTATVAAVLGRELPKGAAPDSRNVLPALTGEPTDEPVRRVMINKSCRGPIAIREGPWKLVFPDGFRPTEEGMKRLRAGKLGKGELYNLAKDRKEQNNRYRDRPKKVKRLRERMARRIRGER